MSLMPDLFDRLPFVVTLEPDEVQLLKRVADETSGTSAGGWQSLVRTLRQRLTIDGALAISDQELCKVHRYIESYGGGGYQQALKGIRRAGWAAGWPGAD